MSETTDKKIAYIKVVARALWAKRKTFIIIWCITFILSATWIFSQPRYYKCEVKLAPETSKNNPLGSAASLASSFGINIGGSSDDAIYPSLYPNLFESPEFLVDILGIQVATDDGRVNTDYYTYLTKHQKKNKIIQLIKDLSKPIVSFFSDKEEKPTLTARDLNSFYLSKEDNFLIEHVIRKKIRCSVSKLTEVITIQVTDQDKLTCALLADSIRLRLQSYITEYRTKKARQDEQYYKHLTDSALIEYEKAIGTYGNYLDHNKKASLNIAVEKGKKLGNDLSTKLQMYNSFNTQYQAMKAKVQEQTPVFSTLKSATVPSKPAGPKRLFFVLTMLALSTIITASWTMRKDFVDWF